MLVFRIVWLIINAVLILGYPSPAEWQLRATIAPEPTKKNNLNDVIPSLAPTKGIAKSIADIQNELKMAEPIDFLHLNSENELEANNIESTRKSPCHLDPCHNKCCSNSTHADIVSPAQPPVEPKVIPQREIPCCDCCDLCDCNCTVPCHDIPWSDWACGSDTSNSHKSSTTNSSPATNIQTTASNTNETCIFSQTPCALISNPSPSSASSESNLASMNSQSASSSSIDIPANCVAPPCQRSSQCPCKCCSSSCSSDPPPGTTYRLCYNSEKLKKGQKPCCSTNDNGEIELRPKICCNNSCCPCYSPCCCTPCYYGCCQQQTPTISTSCSLPCCSNCNCCQPTSPQTNCCYGCRPSCYDDCCSSHSVDGSCSKCHSENCCYPSPKLSPCCCCEDIDCDRPCVCVDCNGKPDIKLQPRPLCARIRNFQTPKPKSTLRPMTKKNQPVTKKMLFPTIKLHQPYIEMPDIPDMPEHPSFKRNLRILSKENTRKLMEES